MKKQQSGLTSQVTFLLTLTCGVMVANIHYTQPIDTQIAQAFRVSIGSIGFVTMLTQLGYALGLPFLVPLGDIVGRRKLVTRVAALSSLSLNAALFTPSFLLSALSSFLVGLLSIVAQIIIPYTMVMMRPTNRGKVTGRMLDGLLTGILPSQTISSFIASAASWRTVYLVAVIFMLVLVVLLQLKLPKAVIHAQASN